MKKKDVVRYNGVRWGNSLNRRGFVIFIYEGVEPKHLYYLTRVYWGAGKQNRRVHLKSPTSFLLVSQSNSSVLLWGHLDPAMQKRQAWTNWSIDWLVEWKRRYKLSLEDVRQNISTETLLRLMQKLARICQAAMTDREGYFAEDKIWR